MANYYNATQGKNATYNVGNVSKTQDQLNNNMSGTDANAIYYATHGGSGNSNYVTGANPTSNPSNVTFSKPIATGTTPSSTSGSKTSGSTSGTTASTSASNGLGDYASMMNSLLAQQRAASEEAYRNSMGRLNSAWDDTMSALDRNRQSTLSQLRNNYDYSSGQAQDDANKSLREAYINYMLNKRNMNQNLSAMGVSGGTSESTMANMYNAYGNSRNNINTTLADNLASLLNTYQNNVNSAEQLYNTQFADARNNYMAQMNALESALANNLVSSYSGGSLSNLANYASKLGGLVQNMADAQWTPTENTLAQSNVSVTQGAGQSGEATNYAKYKAIADDLANNGASASQIITQLQRSGANANDIFSVFNV